MAATHQYSTAGHVSAVLSLTAVLFGGCGDISGVEGGGPAGGPSSESQVQCDVTFRLTSEVSLSVLDFAVDYSRAPGMFIGDGPDVDCDGLIERTAIYHNTRCRGQNIGCPSGPDRKILLGIVGNRTFVGPGDIARCRFAGTRPLEVTDLDIEVRGAGNLYGDENGPRSADIIVGDIDCAGIQTTSTTSTSTTFPSCDEECNAGFACFDGECVAVDLYEMDFRLVDAVTVGALQITVAYDPARGAIVGEHLETRCWSDANNAIVAFNNDVSSGRDCYTRHSRPAACLWATIVSLTGIAGPAGIFSCLLETDDPPLPSDFEITIIDASTPRLQPIRPWPAVTISRFSPVRP